MEENVSVIEQTMPLIGELKSFFEIKPMDSDDPLLFAGVVLSDIILDISPVVEKYFGGPFKAAGKSAFLKNYFDGFTRSIGGMRTEQTVFRKQVSKGLDLYCAFWPWGSNPVKTTVRVGVLCDSEELGNQVSPIMGKYM